MNLAVQRERGGSVQLDLGHETLEASFHKWIREVVIFIVHSFGQNGDVQEQ
jgi:hypothetical protein